MENVTDHLQYVEKFIKGCLYSSAALSLTYICVLLLQVSLAASQSVDELLFLSLLSDGELPKVVRYRSVMACGREVKVADG